MGQDGREEFSQQNGAAYGFSDKFLNVANYSQTFVYFFVWDRKDSLYFSISLSDLYLYPNGKEIKLLLHSQFRVKKRTFCS